MQSYIHTYYDVVENSNEASQWSWLRYDNLMYSVPCKGIHSNTKVGKFNRKADGNFNDGKCVNADKRRTQKIKTKNEQQQF